MGLSRMQVKSIYENIKVLYGTLTTEQRTNCEYILKNDLTINNLKFFRQFNEVLNQQWVLKNKFCHIVLDERYHVHYAIEPMTIFDSATNIVYNKNGVNLFTNLPENITIITIKE